MIRTICSSFLFLLPIYISHVNGDTAHLMLFSTAMGISIANHSHTFHGNLDRRLLFMKIDIFYMTTLSGYLITNSIYNSQLDARIVFLLVAINYGIFRQLGEKRIEFYTEAQRKLHVVFHISGILSMTLARNGLPQIAKP